jgi:hypothetical protein
MRPVAASIVVPRAREVASSEYTTVSPSSSVASAKYDQTCPTYAGPSGVEMNLGAWLFGFSFGSAMDVSVNVWL